MGNKVTICATGDIFLSRRMPEQTYEGLSEVQELIGSHDVRFSNLETTVHREEGTPGAVSGGTWSMCPPEALDDLSCYGFNIYNAANNHALDYSQDGLLATIRHLEERRLPYVGIGKNLSDAAKTVYLECAGARVAMIGLTSTFAPFWVAGEQKHDMKGRPGVNPLRYSTKYYIEKEDLAALKRIAADTGINAAREQSVSEGFAADTPGVYVFGGKDFVEGTERCAKETVLPADLERTVSSIRDARKSADVVLVSIHSHEMGNGRKDCPSEFLQSFARACIDAGAAAVLGHGPHILRGIENYHGGVIFYSLGNFLFENDTVSKMPADLFEKYKLDLHATVGDAMRCRSKDDTIGLAADPRVWNSLIASLEMEDGRICGVRLYPVTLHGDLPVYRRGLPSLTQDETVLKTLQELSAPFDTEIRIENGVGILQLKN